MAINNNKSITENSNEIFQSKQTEQMSQVVTDLIIATKEIEDRHNIIKYKNTTGQIFITKSDVKTYLKSIIMHSISGVLGGTNLISFTFTPFGAQEQTIQFNNNGVYEAWDGVGLTSLPMTHPIVFNHVFDKRGILLNPNSQIYLSLEDCEGFSMITLIEEKQ